jgi:hypothetical protein
MGLFLQGDHFGSDVRYSAARCAIRGLLQKALRQVDLPPIRRETIGEVLHEAGSRSQRTRTWCRTGDALRTRTSGTVTV